jgi:putative ABC transport system substrate-binding protein
MSKGENAAISYRFAENQINRLPELADDLVRHQVAVIFTFGRGVFAAQAATTTIPIIFEMAGDPVQLGLVTSLARPGGNLTGVTSLNAEVGAKLLELLHELVPARQSEQSERRRAHDKKACRGGRPYPRATFVLAPCR